MVHVSLSLIVDMTTLSFSVYLVWSTSLSLSYCRHDDIKFLCLPRIVHVSLSLIVDMTTLSFSVYLV